MPNFMDNMQDALQAKLAGRDFTAAKKRSKRAGRIVFSVFRGVFLFSLCLVLLYPLLIMLSISLRVPIEIFDPTVVWIPKSFTLDAFKLAWQYLDFPTMFFNTFIISVVGTACQLVACVLAGYGFARFQFPFKKLLFGILLLTIIVPTQITSIPTMLYYVDFDFFGLGQIARIFTGEPATMALTNTFWAYFLPALTGAGIRSGLFIFIFIQFFRGLPSELSDAAYIDGCGRFRSFLQIMLPLSGAAILTVTLFSLVWYWNDDLISALHFDGLRTVSIVLQNIKNELNAASTNRDELAMIPQIQAAALISLTPLLALYIVLQKYFTESIERTGIVG